MTPQPIPEEPQMNALLAATLLPGALLAATPNASGTLQLQGATIAIKYAQAVQVPDWFDKTKFRTRLVVSDSPVPPAALYEDMELMSLAREGKFHGIQFEIPAGASNLNMNILSNKIDGNISMGGSFDSSSLKVFTPTRIEGALSQPLKKMGDMQYAYDVRFATDITPYAAPATPTPADTAAAAKAASTQAYLAFTAAVRSGNKTQMLALASPKIRQMMDQPDFAEKLKFVQSMMPAGIRVLKAEEIGDDAKLTVTGSEEGKAKQGTVTMQRLNGKWFLVKESWKSSN
ncbi:MAG: hypothetical protein JST93_34310 [Acidobacteria bacterium]|nr:hypothetical protein [Acidobacteriota bacterium]